LHAALRQGEEISNRFSGLTIIRTSISQVLKSANVRFQRFGRYLRLGRQIPSWTVSPYPAGKAFGFTIVHDADSAYSRRLAPIMEAFDAIGLKITVTVFPFWAAWAPDPVAMWAQWQAQDPFFAPVAVPLEDPEERQFYVELCRRGHEIAMHTPSETSSSRADLIRAFDFFESVFGFPPRMYVEHSPENNLDAQKSSGSDPTTPYYNTDLLNRFGCWVWVCDDETAFSKVREKQFNVLSDEDGPFCPRAYRKFGILRAFLRSPTKPSDGDGFLTAFDDRTCEALEKERGLAIVYTHLAIGWLDPQTRRLRHDIAERLKGLAQRNVWFAPASAILDRFAGIRQVELRSSATSVVLVNRSNMSLCDVTVVAPPGYSLMRPDEEMFPSLPGGLINVGEIEAGATHCFTIVTSNG
jgi:hypothetical protein